jgi:cytochrome c oxidase subunit 2
MDFSTTVLSPGTKQASDILSSFYIMLGVAAFIFVVVAGLVVYASIRFRRREGGPEPKQFRENVGLEVLWISIPTLIVIGLFIIAVRTMSQVNPPVIDRKPDLIVVAHQWWWELHYPQSGVTTANEVHLPVGRLQLLRLISDDVIHDFWVPSLGKKVDIIPGHPNHLWLTIVRPGTYLGTCDEFCGAEHAWMRIRVIAQNPGDFDAWLRHQEQPAAPPSPGAAEKGAGIFEQKNCVNCHSITGVATRGLVAPDLTHVASRETLASGVLSNTPANLYRWLKSPQAIKPGCNMPDLGLSDNQIEYLTAYLGGLK